MAVSVWEQAAGGKSRSGNSPVQTELVKQGDYATLDAESAAYGATIMIGEVLNKLVSWRLTKLPAGKARLTVVTAPMGTSTDTTVPLPIRVVTTINNVQASIPLTRYCGPSQGANAQAYDIARWREEPSRVLYDNYQYKREDGEIVTLSEPSVRLAKKYLVGIEAVMRFYPEIQRVTTYSGGDVSKIAGLGQNLSHIDTPPMLADLMPQWLKTGDVAEVDASGTITRTEKWMGASHFDVNLYGDAPDRWEFGSI